jgi:membrane protein YqaA with SNARE-associated domain
MALLRHVQHSRLGLRGFRRLPPFGLGVLHRRIKGALFDKVTAFLKHFGSLALSLAALLPPPFPTSAFVLSAGATRYRFIAFVLSFGTGRALPICFIGLSRVCVW